ncbi:hypothetical protein QCA50_005502 [Cerrena zonata]|uniref:HNH domain-containing protein n=1 Tax=Cerrena zonata TaxID=2478898 RepID=A0AAW0GH50_9APHY
MASTEEPQFSLFKDALAKRLVAGPDASAETDDLDDFTSYLAAEVWSTLPANVREATYEGRDKVPAADEVYLDSTPTSFADTLTSCGIVGDDEDAVVLLQKVLEEYITEASAPPPVWSKTRTTECEICEREVPLTYHHLIPRETHAKMLKKKWHPEYMLNSVAWLCRPCHSAVHHVASNEELARTLYTVELLLKRDDIQKWRKYAAKQRFGVKRG